MNADPTTLYLAARRDALLLMLATLAVLAWSWERTTLYQVAGGGVSILFYCVAVGVARQGLDSQRMLMANVPRLTTILWILTVLLPAGAAVGLWTAAAYSRLTSDVLVGGVALLTAAWLGWVYHLR